MECVSFVWLSIEEAILSISVAASNASVVSVRRKEIRRGGASAFRPV
jgi:hypothetical protein